MLLRTRKHHPCIALWCGGNELYLAQEYQHPEAPVYGEKSFARYSQKFARGLTRIACITLLLPAAVPSRTTRNAAIPMATHTCGSYRDAPIRTF